MNTKILAYFFMVLGFVLLFSQIYALECDEQTGPAGANSQENGKTCVCTPLTKTEDDGTKITTYYEICSQGISKPRETISQASLVDEETDSINIDSILSNQCNSGASSDTESGNSCISYWWGKVNLHLIDGEWITDPDGVSGADIDKLEYCKKFWPNTNVVKAAGIKKTNVWKNRGNQDGPFYSEKMAYKCIVDNSLPSCREVNGACCEGDICNESAVTCESGTTTKFVGCDEQCVTKVKCIQANQDCSAEIEAYNKQIKDLYAPYIDSIQEKQTNIKNAKDEINNLLKEYKECKIINQEDLNIAERTSPITGNFGFANASQVNASIATSIDDSIDVMSVTTTSDSGTVSGGMGVATNTNISEADQQLISSEDVIATIDKENNSFIASVDARLETIARDTNVSSDCLVIISEIRNQKQIIETNLAELNKFKEDNQDLMNKIKELFKLRNELIRDCVGITNSNFECNIPIELLDQLRGIETKMSNTKEEINTEIDPSQDRYSEYTAIKEEYLLIKNKIQAIKDDCKIRMKVSTGQGICSEKADILKSMDQIKSELELTTSDEDAYQLKTKLEYMQQKYSNVICAEPTTSAVGTTEVAPASINDMETCVNSLVEKAGVEQDIARNACSQKYSAESQGYQERLLALEKKIQEQQAIITNLKSRISDIQEKLNNATPEEKAKFIEDNASDIKSDTIAKIDKKIESLKKLIENIDSSEMDDAKKAEMIDSINNNIASLEMQKANIENAETTEELKVYLTEARNADNLANKEAIISSLEKQTLELETIIDKYFRANADYQNLVTEINALKEKISTISSESTSEEINSIKEEYKALRDKIKSIAQESVVQ